MTPEEKRLLTIDLCGRLSYGVKGLQRGKVHKLFTIDSRDANNACLQVDGYDAWFPIETFKPYLRSMESITEEEKIELCTISYAPDEMKTIEEKLYVVKINAKYAADFYNKHHFDYRGLIPMGLALEAPANMYKED